MFITNLSEEQRSFDIPLADGTQIRDLLQPGETRAFDEINPYDVNVDIITRQLVQQGEIRVSFAEEDNDLIYLPRILPAVEAASTGNVAAVAGLQTIDGVSLNVGDRVLLKDQLDTTENGIYQVQAGGWFRSLELEFREQFYAHIAVFAKAGITNAGAAFTLVSPEFPVIGTDPVLWGVWPGGGGGGAIDDAINVGVGGVGVVAAPSVSGTDLRFRSISSPVGSGIDVTLDAPNETVQIEADFVEIANNLEFGSPLVFGADRVGATTTTRYLYAGNAERLAEITPYQILVTRPGNLQRFRVLQNVPNGNGSAIAYTVRVNGVATALAVSIPSTTGGGADLLSTVPVAAGDAVDVEITKAAGVGSSPRNVVATVEVK